MFVSSIESIYGYLNTLSIWIVCAVGGNIFSADFASEYSISVGASTSLFGMIGLFLAYFILNWNALGFL